MASSSMEAAAVPLRHKKWDKKINAQIAEEVVKFYASKTGGNYSKELTQLKFQHVRNRRWIRRILERYERRQCLYKSGGRTCPRTERTAENMEKMKQILEENPTISIRGLGMRLNMTFITVQRMLTDLRNPEAEAQYRNQGEGGAQKPADVVDLGDGEVKELKPVLGPTLPIPGDCSDDQDHGGAVLDSSYSGPPLHCFLCNALDVNVLDLSFPISATAAVPVEVDRSAGVICFLKNILQMRDEDLQGLMTKMVGRNPSQWLISVCTNPDCRDSVEKAFALWKEMQRLELDLAKRRKEILERMRSCLPKKKGRKGKGDDLKIVNERAGDMLKRVQRQVRKEVELEQACSGEPKVKIEVEEDVDNFNSIEDFSTFEQPTNDMEYDYDPEKVKVESGDEEANLRRRSSRAKRVATKLEYDDFRYRAGGKASRNQSKGPNEDLHSCKWCPHLERMDIDQFIAHACFHTTHPFKCSLCNFYFPKSAGADQVQKHFDERHQADTQSQSQPTKVIQVPVDTTGMWPCSRPKCRERFDSVKERQGHELHFHPVPSRSKSVPEPKVACSVCLSRFYTLTEVRLHKAIEHPEDYLLSCCYCNSQFTIELGENKTKVVNFDQLSKHIHDKHPKRVWQSPQWKVSTPSKSKPFSTSRFLQTCPICGLVLCYTKFHHLDTHLARVHGMCKHETYDCPVCSKRITYATFWSHTKQKHLPVKGEKPKPYVCQFCGKAFGRLDNWKEHERIHTNKYTRPFQCELCGASFAVKSYLWIHRRVTHQKRPSPSAIRKREAKLKARAARQASQVSSGEGVPETSSTIQVAQNSDAGGGGGQNVGQLESKSFNELETDFFLNT